MIYLAGIAAGSSACCYRRKHSHLPLAAAGGMIYVSDKAGDNDFALLERLVLPDGTTLRCRQPGCPTLDCLFADVSRDRRTVLKVRAQGFTNGVGGVECSLRALYSPGCTGELAAADTCAALTAR